MAASTEKRVLGSGIQPCNREPVVTIPAPVASPLALVRRFAVDVSPLRESRDFRLLWLGELISQTGNQITMVALFVQVDRITGSTAAVGAIGLVQLGPMVVASLFGGPYIDSHDRRRILLLAQTGLMGASTVLLLGSLAGDPPLALLYVAAAANGALMSVTMPTRAAMTPNLVPMRMLPSAAALNQVMWNTAAIVGPAAGGVIVGRVGLSWAYGIDVATYVFALAFVFLLRPQVPRRVTGEPAERGWAAVMTGVRFLRGKRILQSTFTVDIVAMVFGMPRALFPILAREQFGHGAEAVGWLFSAVALGALLGALASGWVSRVRRQGLAVLVAVTIWGSGIIAFGLAGGRLVLALACLAVAGAADVISAVFRSTIQQLTVPDELRGRLMSFNILVVAGGPRLGDFEAGVVASVFTPTVSVVSGGVLCVAGVGLIAALVPRFARWQPGDPP
jgi:MFS family permease